MKTLLQASLQNNTFMMKKLEKKDLKSLVGYCTYTTEVIKNGEKGYYFDEKSKKITIVTCCANCGDYSRVVFTPEALFLGNCLGNGDDADETESYLFTDDTESSPQ